MEGKLAGCPHRDDPIESDTPRSDASFTEIYELIFHNDSLVRSELEVLKLLIHNKLKNGASPTSTKDVRPMVSVYNKQAMPY